MIPSVPASEPASIASLIARLQEADPRTRHRAAAEIFRQGRVLAQAAIATWLNDTQLRGCLRIAAAGFPEMIVGIAVDSANFESIRAAAGMPGLADVPPDQDAKEFELVFPEGVLLDVLTTREPAGHGALSRYLQKFGVGIQQIEILSHDVDRATQILRTRFSLDPMYPATRAGAGGTRINFFLVPVGQGRKVLIEIVQEAATP